MYELKRDLGILLGAPTPSFTDPCLFIATSKERIRVKGSPGVGERSRGSGGDPTKGIQTS